MKKVYLVAAKRSAVGSFMGSISTLNPTKVAGEVLKQTLESANIPKDKIDEVIVGNVLPAGLGQGPARQVSLFAGVPLEVPAYSLNMVCGSGMKTVMNGFSQIQAGLEHLVVCGGMETMSQAPYLVPSQARSGIKMGNQTLVDHMINDSLWDVYNQYHMGITAENIAEKYQITREQQDEFALNSQVKAAKAQDENKFFDEIVPVEVKTRKETILFDKDEYINRGTNLEKLAKLRPAFTKEGTVTAGNASGLNDGVSFVVLASEEAVKKYNLKPLVEVVGVGQGGVDPKVMGLGPVPAIRHALQNCNLKLSDIDLIELNEAFAAQSLGVIHELIEEHKVTRKFIDERTNVNGGAIAIGHPVGASGNRIIVTLVHEMLRSNKKLGLASLCIGGGMGTAVIFKNLK